MQIQQVVRTEPERVLINVRCVEASSITTGMGVVLALGTAGTVASADGINAVILPVTSNGLHQSFIGVAKGDIASNAYGLVIAWGFADSVALSQETDKTIGVLAGAGLLRVSAVAGQFASSVAAEVISTYCGKYALNAVTTNISSALPYTKALIRCL